MTNYFEIEQSVLGAILTDDSVIDTLILQDEHFSQAEHKIIYRAMQSLKEKEKPIDVMTMTGELDKQLEAVGGISYLVKLVEAVPTLENVKFHEQILFEAYRNKKFKEISIENAEKPSFENIDETIEKLEKIKNEGVIEKEKTTYDHLISISDEMGTVKDESQMGYKTGFTQLDNLLGGFQRSDLIIIGARPSMGKTAFGLNVASGHCENGGTSHIFSLEMLAEALLKRVISAAGNIDGKAWLQPKFEMNDYKKGIEAIGKISEWKLEIHEKKMYVEEIVSTMRKIVRERPNERHLVVIDYLTKLKTAKKYDRRYLEIGAITNELKNLALELEIPIILLAQLSRSVEHRQDKRPMMSDLRDSGEIEQEADVIGFLYRDDYYNDDSDESNLIEIDIDKHRNGPTGKVELAFAKEYGKFINLDYRYN